jgi:hypothetical protein
MTISTQTLINLHNKAIQAAQEAAGEVLSQHMTSNPDCMIGEPEFPCGVSWVSFRVDGRSKMAKIFKEAGFETGDLNKGFQVSNPSGHDGQNCDIKHAGSIAYADYMNRNGVTCSPRQYWT